MAPCEINCFCEKSWSLLKVHLFDELYDLFLKVTSILTGKTEGILLAGSIDVEEMVLREPLNWQRSVLTFRSKFTETLAGLYIKLLQIINSARGRNPPRRARPQDADPRA